MSDICDRLDAYATVLAEDDRMSTASICELVREAKSEIERLQKALAYWEDLGLDYELLEKDDE